MMEASAQVSDAKAVIDRFFSVRTGVSIFDLKPGQVAVATCDRRTYAEPGYGFIRLLWVLHLGDRAVVSVHPSALAETARLAWAATPDDVLGDEFGARVATLLRKQLSGRPMEWGAPAIKFYHPGGAARGEAEGEIRTLVPADKEAWAGPREYGHAAEHPGVLKGEGFGLFLGRVLVGDVMTHGAPVAELADLIAEDGIEVAEGHRGRGYGRALLAHWTREMQQRGRACIHGTSLENAASMGIARAVGYVEYARHRGVNYALP